MVWCRGQKIPHVEDHGHDHVNNRPTSTSLSPFLANDKNNGKFHVLLKRKQNESYSVPGLGILAPSYCPHLALEKPSLQKSKANNMSKKNTLRNAKI